MFFQSSGIRSSVNLYSELDEILVGFSPILTVLLKCQIPTITACDVIATMTHSKGLDAYQPETFHSGLKIMSIVESKLILLP